MSRNSQQPSPSLLKGHPYTPTFIAPVDVAATWRRFGWEPVSVRAEIKNPAQGRVKATPNRVSQEETA